MKYIFKIVFLFLLICCELRSNGQASGVYMGNLLSSKNAFAITIKDTIATGTLYTNQYESFVFQGFFSKNVIRGYFVEYGEPRVILAKLLSDTLKIDFISSKGDSVEKQCIMVRVSSNANYNIEKIFSKEKTEHDERLIGKWVIVKSVNSRGENTLNEIYVSEFLRHGVITYDSPTYNKLVEELAKNKIIKPTTNWETKGNKIIFHSSLHGTSQYPIPREFIVHYYFSSDTLIEVGDFYKHFSIKKK